MRHIPTVHVPVPDTRSSLPDPLFQIPSSFLDVSTARLVMGRGLPEGAGEFTLGFGIFFAVTTMIKMKYADRWWQNLIPSGVAFVIG